VAFLLLAVVMSAVGITVILLRNRRPTSLEHSIAEFEKGRRALSPEPEPPASGRRRSE
jgi:hypothetical protein